MNDLKNKLLSLNETKGLIRDAIVDREVEVPEGTPFRDYANRIRAIPLGGAAALNIAYGDTAPADTSKLWVKGDAPKVVRVSAGVDIEGARSVANFGNATKYIVESAAAAVGNKIYVCCGNIGTSYTDYYYGLLIYDIKEKTASYTHDKFKYSPGAIYRHNVVAVGKKVFVIGGYEGGSSNNDVVSLDTETLNVKHEGGLDQYIYSSAAAVVGNMIYVIGGMRRTSSYAGTQRHSADITAFNVENNSCKALSCKLPIALDFPIAASFGTTVYIFGGRNTDNQEQLAVYAFDTEEPDYSKAVRKLDVTLPMSVSGWQCGRIGKYIYIFRGTVVLKFDPENETIENMGVLLPSGATNRCVAITEDSAYIIGGDVGNYANSYDRYLHTIDKFTPETVMETGEMVLEVDPTGQQVELVKQGNLTMHLGIRGVYRGNSEGIAEKAQAYLWGIRDILHGYESATQVNSGTELTAEVETKAGQLVIAAVAARDSFTLSDGWTLISESAVNSTDTAGQRLAFAYKYATADTESITVTQASAQRLYINLVALDGATGYTDNGYTYKDTETETTISAAKPAGLTLWACVAPLWSSVLPYPQWKADNDPYRIDLGDRVQSRLAIFLDQSEAETVTFTAASNSTAIVGCLTIEGMAEFYEGDGSGWCKI